MLIDTVSIGDYRLADYLSGRCHLFALAMNQATGLPLAVWLDDEAWYDDLEDPAPALDHAFCLHPYDTSAGIDANGPRDLNDIEGEYASASNAHLLLSGEQAKRVILEWRDLGLLNDFDTGEKAALIHFIQTHLPTLIGPVPEPGI